MTASDLGAKKVDNQEIVLVKRFIQRTRFSHELILEVFRSLNIWQQTKLCVITATSLTDVRPCREIGIILQDPWYIYMHLRMCTYVEHHPIRTHAMFCNLNDWSAGQDKQLSSECLNVKWEIFVKRFHLSSEPESLVI